MRVLLSNEFLRRVPFVRESWNMGQYVDRFSGEGKLT